MGGKSSNERSISKPYYPATPGGEGYNLTDEEVKKFTVSKEVVDRLNKQFQNENPLLTIADETVQFTKNMIFIGIGLSAGYLAVEGYKAYKS